MIYFFHHISKGKLRAIIGNSQTPKTVSRDLYTRTWKLAEDSWHLQALKILRNVKVHEEKSA